MLKRPSHDQWHSYEYIYHHNAGECHGSVNITVYNSLARRGGAEVAGWTLDRKIRVRFPAYPHRVWAL